MEELMWAAEQAAMWVEKHGGFAAGLTRQMDGRWFLRVVTREENWDAERNLYVTREADLGACPEDACVA